MSTSVVARSRVPLSTCIDGEVVMLQPATSEYFGLGGPGARIWELLERPQPIAALTSQLAVEYEVDQDQCLRDVLPFLAELHREGLIAVA